MTPKTAPDQQVCRDIHVLKSGPASKTSISLHNRRSEHVSAPKVGHTCWGIIHVQTNGYRTKAAWRPNRSWECPACRRWLVNRDVTHYLRVIGDTPVVTFTITETAWRTRQQQLRRAGLDSNRIPQPDGLVVIIGEAAPGEQPLSPEQLATTLTSAIANKPQGKKISSTGKWNLTTARNQADDDAGDSNARGIRASKQWHTIGIITATSMRELVETSKRLGNYKGPLKALHEEHELTGITSAWVRAVGMQRIDDERRWWREGTAA